MLLDSTGIASIERACSKLLTVYAQAIDRNDGAAAARLFAPDGVFTAGPRSFTGHDELARITEGRPEGLISRHLLATILITAESEVSATGVAYYVVFRGQRASAGDERPLPMELPFSMGEWHSRFVRLNGDWRIARQEVRRLFQAQG